jgi:hypothetical protein
MKWLERAKIGAEIAEIAADIYATLIDKSRSMAEKDARIKHLEAEKAELMKRLAER